jgi:hypothetical protein
MRTPKPAFEILDPVINMAQQMEHHGVQVKSGKVNADLVTTE